MSKNIASSAFEKRTTWTCGNASRIHSLDELWVSQSTSFQSGYLKRLDWNLYTSLESSIAKRLYRFLDKRFFHGNTFEMDLRELAINRMGLSSTYNVAQMKRGLLKGIEELEKRWDLRPIPPEKRFLKLGCGNWSIRFERKRRPAIPKADVPIIQPLMDLDPTQLQFALTKRGIGPASAEELSQAYPAQSIKLMIELFDWYNQRGQSRGAGFLVQSIKNPNSIELPAGFESSQQVQSRHAAEKNRICAQRDFSIKRERIAAQAEETRSQAFMAFWQGMSPTDQMSFERMALDNAEPTKRTGYSRHQGKGGRLFEQYRQVILRDHFERTALSIK